MGLALLLVAVAAVFQGSFIPPMNRTRGWKWEQTWLSFSLLGMFVLIWALAVAILPNPIAAMAAAPSEDILILLVFGAGWGVGAVLFGIAMDRLGMSVGYPLIMGLIACLGALIPLALSNPEALFAKKGLLVISGTALAIVGMTLCSVGAAKRDAGAGRTFERRGGRAAFLLAMLAGILSSLPNVGASFGTRVTQSFIAQGASPQVAGDGVWVLLFTAGGVVNCGYCAALLLKNRGGALRVSSQPRLRNWLLTFVMAALWIGSFYLYGLGAGMMGKWGLIAGWPLFIFLSIAVGVVWGLTSGEWQGAPVDARRFRDAGLAVILFALPLIALSEV
jgi:L-rhamnose-H+ transport protein